MKREEIREQVMKCISRVADIDIDEITEDSTLMDDLVLNSLEVFNVVADLEDEYNIVIPEKDIRGYVTVSNMVDALNEKVNTEQK